MKTSKPVQDKTLEKIQGVCKKCKTLLTGGNREILDKRFHFHVLKVHGNLLEKGVTLKIKGEKIMVKNLKAKTRKVEDPYEIYTDPRLPNWEWRVLKHYQTPENEKKNPYARVFCAVKSSATFDSWEYGDTYLTDLGKTKIK